QTDHLLVSEPVAIKGNHYRLASVVKAIESPQEYREELDLRSEVFERLYPALKKNGILALLLLPLLLFGLMLLLDAKLPTIACFVIALIAIYVFLILVEFFHDRIEHKRMLTELPESELYELEEDILREEFMPMARIESILERREKRHATRKRRPFRRRTTTETPETSEGDGEMTDDFWDNLPQDEAADDDFWANLSEDENPVEDDKTQELGSRSDAPRDESVEGGDE
ncbi:MAG: hypothetical protein Q4B54_10055, partial [Coriobacteriales bacterium]|nr:hypothetical protein [Coriobacteriales bacterium]